MTSHDGSPAAAAAAPGQEPNLAASPSAPADPGQTQTQTTGDAKLAAKLHEILGSPAMLASRDRLEAEFRERGKALPKLPADELIEILKDLYAELFANTLKLALAAKIGATEEDMVHIVDTIRATGLTLADVCSMAPFPIPDRSAGKDPAAAAAPEGGAA